MRMSTIILANGSSLVGNSRLDFATWSGGTQGMLVFETSSPGLEMQLVLKSTNGTDISVTSSYVLTSACAIGPLYLPAGLYAIKNVSSSAIAVYASLNPTP